jgi:hypothetical protein
MPPRRSARVAAMAERATSALSPLPLSVVLHIFSLLPVDCRLRCAEVCRGWRAVLSECSLWTRLDMSAASGVPVRHRDVDALLRCAAARAAGGLQSLQTDDSFVSRKTLLAVATANAGALRELRADGRGGGVAGFELDEAEALLGAAPLLRVFATELSCYNTTAQAVRRALRNETPFAPLRVRHLSTNLGDVDEAGVIAFAADAAAHASLTGLSLDDVPLHTLAALDAVVDAALARRLQSVHICNCRLSSASVPALARLLGGGALTTLAWDYANLLDAPAAAMLAAALRANSTLTSLTLDSTYAFVDAAAGAELLGALTAHPSVRALGVTLNPVGDADVPVVGAAFGALLAANAPALTELDVPECYLGDAGLRPLFEALPSNTHLRRLFCPFNDITGAFARDVLLPAVRANTSLRKLVTGADFESAVEAERIVSSRAAA